MNLHSILTLVGLALCSIYCTIPLFWLVVHPFVDRWRIHGRRSFAVLLPAWALFAATAFALAWRFRDVHLYQSYVPWAPGGLFILMGLAIYRTSFRDFDHTKVSGLSELEPFGHDQRLVVSGIRSQVRHPIYLGHFCEVFGWCLGTGSLSLLALLGFAVLTGAVMIKREDDELEERFGAPYQQYRRTVPAFLPRMWK